MHADRGVYLQVSLASEHGVSGEDGAGKFTLMNILHGIHRTDRDRDPGVRSPDRPEEERGRYLRRNRRVPPPFMLVES